MFVAHVRILRHATVNANAGRDEGRDRSPSHGGQHGILPADV
jgi:hypothetical protein